MSRVLLSAISRYVRIISMISHGLGLVAMYGLFVMMGILTYAVIANNLLNSPAVWVMEMAQFSMAAYYLIGGGYTLKEGAHVRMDVFYERWGPRAKAIVDSITGLAMLFFLGLLVWGGIESTKYSLDYSQRNFTAWAPPLAPIKILMTTGMALMLLQAIAIFLKDIVKAIGKELPE
jgi:TRAP-type C4-dicarboxylate transport system permease small subunit